MNIFKAILILAYTAMATAAVTPASAEARAKAVCGDLGVLEVIPGELPEGVVPSDLRLCADHPLGRNRTLDPEKGASVKMIDDDEGDLADPDTTPAPSLHPFEQMACYTKASMGCSGGYCWKQCGNKIKGEWCWTANAFGAGAWRTCKRWQDCDTNNLRFGCGKGCLKPFVCGCSC